MKLNYNKYRNRLQTLLKVMALPAIMLMATGCVTESFDEAVDSKAPRYFISLDVVVPQNPETRSTTEPDGSSTDETLNGTTNESTVNDATIYICLDDEVKVILRSVGEPVSNSLTGTKYEKHYTVTAEVTENLADIVELCGEECRIYVVANGGQLYQNTFENLSDETTPDETNPGETDPGETTPVVTSQNATFSLETNVNSLPAGDYLGEGGAQGKVLPMSNASQALKLQVPATEAELRSLFNGTAETNYRYNLGTVELERMVARFDIRDKDRNAEDPEDKPWVYKVGDGDLNIELYSVQAFNVSKEAYLFRHTATGTRQAATGKASLFENENGNEFPDLNLYKWIADPSWNFSGTQSSSTGTYTKTLNPTPFYNRLTTNSGYSINNGAGEMLISELTSTAEGKVREKQGKNGDLYYPWCYVTENTIPNVDLMDESTLPTNATGIAFKFLVLDEDGNPLVYNADMENYPSEVTNSEEKAGNIVITTSDQKWMEVAPKNGKFYLTYYGFITHNNTTQNVTTGEGEDRVTTTLPGAMKYGVVRNNLYQMYISNIDHLPFPEDPKTLYLKLQLAVLSWAKREISVEF